MEGVDAPQVNVYDGAGLAESPAPAAGPALRPCVQRLESPFFSFADNSATENGFWRKS